MSKLKFIVRDIDIKPISGASVHVLGTDASGDLTTDSNGLTAPVNLTKKNFSYRVTHPDFAADGGGGSFSVTGQSPEGKVDTGQILSMKWYQSGGEDLVEVCVILGKIAPPLSTGIFNQDWRSLDTPLNPIHATGKAGWDRFNASHTAQAAPQGEYLTCEVMGMGLPRLVATWQPKRVTLLANTPVNYLLYFHPFRKPAGPYPFDPDYVELGKTYLGNPRRTIAHMTHQGISAIGVVPIYPLTAEGLAAYEALTMTQAYRLIREVNFFLQMRAHAQLFTQWRVKQPVGKVAICCFSRSIEALSSLLAKRGTDKAMAAEFFDQKLREVYAFDPVPDVASAFMSGVASWFRKGADGRRFRLYTEFGGWEGAFTAQQSALGGAGVKPVSWDAAESGANMKEWHGPDETFTFALCNLAFCQPVVDIIKTGGAPSLDAERNMDVHSFFPGYFMGHALANSSLK